MLFTDNPPVEIKKQCGSCIHMAQGLTCSFCAHPDQKDRKLRGYVYYNFSCSLFGPGTHQSILDYQKDPDKFMSAQKLYVAHRMKRKIKKGSWIKRILTAIENFVVKYSL